MAGPQGWECCSVGAPPLAEGLAEKWEPYILASSGDLLLLNGTRPARLWGCSMLGGGAGWVSVWCCDGVMGQLLELFAWQVGSLPIPGLDGAGMR